MENDKYISIAYVIHMASRESLPCLKIHKSEFHLGTRPAGHNEHACMYQIDLTNTVTAHDVSDLLADTSWAIRSTIDIVPEASQFAAIFGRAYYSIYP